MSLAPTAPFVPSQESGYPFRPLGQRQIQPLTEEKWNESVQKGRYYYMLMHCFHEDRLQSKYISMDHFINENWSIDDEFPDDFSPRHLNGLNRFFQDNGINPDQPWNRINALYKYPDPNADRFDSVSLNLLDR